MKFSLLSTATAAAMIAVVAQTAFAQETPTIICSSRMDPLARAQCLVNQRNELLRKLGRLPSSSSSSTSSSTSSSSSSSSSSSYSFSSVTYAAPGQPRSCSRVYGKEKALCLVEQRKEILEQLKKNPPKSSSSVKPVIQGFRAQNCVRELDGAKRAACYAAQRGGSSSK